MTGLGEMAKRQFINNSYKGQKHVERHDHECPEGHNTYQKKNKRKKVMKNDTNDFCTISFMNSLQIQSFNAILKFLILSGDIPAMVRILLLRPHLIKFPKRSKLNMISCSCF